LLTAGAILITGAGLWSTGNWPEGFLGLPAMVQDDRFSYVEVNFISTPFNATIHLEGKILKRLDGTPYVTPCTALVPAGSFRTVLKRDGYQDLELGFIDYSTEREVEATWPNMR
jgi:hypothetical protein